MIYKNQYKYTNHVPQITNKYTIEQDFQCF